MSLKEKLNYYQQRVILGSFSIKPQDMPISLFLIGYFVGQSECNIDQLFELFDLIAELADQKHISSLMKKQIYSLVEDYPHKLKDMVRGLTEFKSKKRDDLIGWIQSFYQDKKQPPTNYEIAVRHPIQRTGTLELDHSDHTQELNEGFSKQQIINEDEQADLEMARRLQEEMDKQNVGKGQQQEVLCQICYCGLYDDQFQGLDNCGHFFHINCMSESFKTNILSNTFPLRCPNVDCLKEVTEADIKRILDDRLFQKYQSHTLKAYAQGHGQSISWCPTANCTNMFFFEKDDPQRFECSQCKKQYCLNCRVQWHKQMTCKEYKVSSTMSQEDQKFLEFAKGKKFKQCPKCKFWVEKNDGCDHMTCKCKFEFCYKCGGVYMKCECMEEFRRMQERRRAQAQERRRQKAQKRSEATRKVRQEKRQEKLRRDEQLRRQREERNNQRNTRSRRRK